MKRSEINDKITTGLVIDEDNILVVSSDGKQRTILPLAGAEFDLNTGKVVLKYILPAKQRAVKTLTVKSKGGK